RPAGGARRPPIRWRSDRVGGARQAPHRRAARRGPGRAGEPGARRWENPAAAAAATSRRRRRPERQPFGSPNREALLTGAPPWRRPRCAEDGARSPVRRWIRPAPRLLSVVDLEQPHAGALAEKALRVIARYLAPREAADTIRRLLHERGHRFARAGQLVPHAGDDLAPGAGEEPSVG